MRTFPERLKAAGITPNRYRELQAICRDYPDYKRRLRRARAGIVDRPARASGACHRPDPTAGEAMFLAAHPAARRVKLIEDCARRVAEPCVAAAILKNVTEDISWEKQRPPIGMNQFYAIRLAFYVELDRRLWEIENR